VRIAYITNQYPCLSESFINAEIEGLIGCGNEVFVFALGWDKNIAVCDDVKVIYKKSIAVFGLRAFLNLLKTSLSVFRECPREGFSLLKHFWMVMFFVRQVKEVGAEFIYCSFLSWPGLIGVAVSNITGVKMGIAAHSRDVFVESGALNFKAARAEFITVCNVDAMESLKAKLSEQNRSKLHLNYHIQNNDKNSYKLICVGRLVEKKGFDVAIGAFGRLLKKRQDIELWIVGAGSERKKLERLVRKSGIESKIFMTGALPKSITRALIESADVLIFSGIVGEDGDRDGVANVVLEAMALKTAVIASDIKSLEDIVVDGVCGMVFEKKNEKKLARVINKLLGCDALREKTEKNAYELVKRRFGSGNIEGISELIEGCCGNTK